MKLSAFILLVSLLVSLLPAAEVTNEARPCYEWFATLGFPEVKDAKWAEARLTYDSFNGDENGVRKFLGFIVAETDKDFSLLLPDLTVKTMLRGVSNLEFVVRGTFEERSFPAWAAEQLPALRNPPKDGFRRFGAHLGHKTEVFALSYFCWRRGEAGLAAQLYAEAEKLPVSLHGYERKKTVSDMREALEIELGHAAMWDAVLRMGGGSLAGGSWSGSGRLQPRAEVLDAFRRIVKLFPRCEHIERAKTTIAMLERMVTEDAEHPLLTQAQIDALPPDQRIAELVWLLRDQNGHQMSQPGWCEVLGFGDGDSAGHQLVKIGYPAAPALIEALTDDHFSRSVGFHRDFYFSHTILTIGDCAQQILQKISGQNFYSPGSEPNEDKMLAVQKAARAWWEGYQKKGLKQMLVDDISSGQKSPYALVRQLKKEDASAVEAAVLAGAAKATNEAMACQFIDELDAFKSPQSIAALATIMKNHSSMHARLDAAARLLNRDHPDALPALLREWSVYQTSKESFHAPFETLADMLACHGSDRAVEALIHGWEDRGPGQRLKIVEKLGECMARKPRTHGFASRAVPHKPEPAALSRAIALLARALEDMSTDYGISGGGPELVYGEASTGDFALRALHELDPDRFVFTPTAGPRRRNRERIAAANSWRKEHSQPLLPAPPPPGPKLPPADALKIVRVSLQGGTLAGSSELAQKLGFLQNTRFDAHTFPKLLVWFAQTQPPGVTSLDLQASRENDLTGVEIVARLRMSPTKAGNDPEWHTRHCGHCGSQRLGSSSGSCSHAHAISPECWDDFTEATTKALEQPPETEFIFKAGLSRK
ncbi:MAG: hypothetical protein JNN17_12100 [Verrucomicrobiaceae bacterium]|nr:hypothetical protein [Verrucomicrobiaceae bacterium]